MKWLTELAIVAFIFSFLFGNEPQSSFAGTSAIWTGGGGDNGIRNANNWQWLGEPPGYDLPDDDTDVTLDHTALGTTIGFYQGDHLDSNTVAVGNGTDSVAYDIVSYADLGHWELSVSNGFTVKNGPSVLLLLSAPAPATQKRADLHQASFHLIKRREDINPSNLPRTRLALRLQMGCYQRPAC